MARARTKLTIAITVSVMTLAAVVAASVPSASQGTVASELQRLGVPQGAEIVFAQGNKNGKIVNVQYRGADGKIVEIGRPARLHTPAPSN